MDSWLFAGFPTRLADLAIFRILYALYLLCQLPRGEWLRDAPQAFFSPPLGLAALGRGLPAYHWIVALNIAVVLSAAALLIGWRTRLASLAAGCGFMLLNSWCYAFGKINHDIFVVVIPLVLAFSGWGNAFSIDARKKGLASLDDQSGSWAVALCCFAIGVAMFTAGFAKLTSGWLDPGLLCTYGHLISLHFINGRHTWLEKIMLEVDVPFLWKLLDWFVVMLETGFLAAIWNRRLFVTFCALAAFFHLGVWLLFDIPFGSNLVGYGVIVPFTLLPIPGLGKAALGVTARFFRGLPAWLLLMVVFGPVLLAVLRITRHPTAWMHVPVWEIVLTSALILSAGYFSQMAFALRNKKARRKTSTIPQTRQAA